MNKSDIKNSNPIILIVDDEPRNLQILGTILMEQNYNVVAANNGKKTLNVLQQISPDLILLDVMMPEMDGYETCIKIKKTDNLKDIPVIFLTARVETNDIIKGFKAGAIDYITKPFNHSELLTRISTQLELKKSRDALIKTEKELRVSNSTKDKFFSIIAHDLKNPFNILLNFSNILANEFDDLEIKEQKEYIGFIQLSAKNTYELLQNLLMWSRLQRKKIELIREKINIYSLANDTIELLRQTAINKSIIIKNLIPNDIFVNADKNMMSTIIRNLLSNSLKFTPKKGSVTLKGQIIIDEKNQNTVNLSVKDTGVGISTEIQSKLFSISHNVSTKGTEKEGGTGLGLILCKEFVEMHGGEIKVESKIDMGSTFTFSIPGIIY